MGLSEAMLFAFAATIICAFAIAEKIIDIDFEQFMPKNLKKAKMKRILRKLLGIRVNFPMKNAMVKKMRGEGGALCRDFLFLKGFHPQPFQTHATFSRTQSHRRCLPDASRAADRFLVSC